MQDPALVRLCPGECELRSGAAVDEQPLTGTERQGKDEQMQLVDEPVGEHGSNEGAAAADVDVAVDVRPGRSVIALADVSGHVLARDAFDPNQEEVYIPLSGAATLVADGSEFELRPGTMVRVGPDQLRQLLPGPDGIRFVAIGGSPGAFTPGAWTELGADPPSPPAE